jgi:chromate transporter
MVVLSLLGIMQDIWKEQWSYHLEKSMMRKDVRAWLSLLAAFLIPACIINRSALEFAGNGILSAMMSFGGGDAYLTIADGLFVQNGMITEHQYYGQIISAVNILPGSILCKTLSGIGYYTGLNLTGQVSSGVLFAVAGFICSLAASCGFFSIVYYLYDSLITLSVFRMISRWIRPIIAGLLLNIVIALCNQCITTSSALNLSTNWILGGILMLCVADFLWIRRFGKNVFGALLINIVTVFAISAYL